MSILIAVLKIIGILLLIILAVIGVVLFHPVYYRVQGEAEDDISVKGHFWWLFQMIRLEFEIRNHDAAFQWRIFGIAKERKTDAEDTGQDAWEDSDTVERDETAPEEPLQSQEPEKSKLRGKSSEKSKPSRRSSEKSKLRRKSSGKKKQWKNTLASIKKEISDEKNHQAISVLWREILYLLAHLKPDYIRADLSFSAGDPALTGQITGALSLLPVIYQYDAYIYPDFTSEKFYIKGNLNLKGHMALIHPVRSLIRLIRDQNIRRFLSKFRTTGGFR